MKKIKISFWCGILACSGILHCGNVGLEDITEKRLVQRALFITPIAWGVLPEKVFAANNADFLCQNTPPCFFDSPRGLYIIEEQNKTDFEQCEGVFIAYKKTYGSPTNPFGQAIDTEFLVNAWCSEVDS